MSKLEPTRTYSNLTATKRLRAMLDERGVFWVDIPRKDMTRTVWKESDGQLGYCYFDENEFGVTTLLVSSPTPEQAIAATLGAETCRKLPPDNGMTCIVRNRGFEMEFGYWKCSECGTNCFDGARYCMKCGAKVVDA